MILSSASTSNDSQITIISPASTPGNTLKDFTISIAVTVIAANLLAGFNPRLLDILAFLANTMLTSTGHRKDISIMTAFFSLGIFVVYIIFGIGLFSVFREVSASIFRFVLVVVLLGLGPMQLEDARRLQSGNPSLFRTD